MNDNLNEQVTRILNIVTDILDDVRIFRNRQNALYGEPMLEFFRSVRDAQTERTPDPTASGERRVGRVHDRPPEDVPAIRGRRLHPQVEEAK